MEEKNRTRLEHKGNTTNAATTPPFRQWSDGGKKGESCSRKQHDLKQGIVP